MADGTTVYCFTSELPGLKRYYETALGVKGEQHGPCWVQFPLKNGVFALHGQDPEAPEEENRFHISFTVENLERSLERFARNGGTVVQGIQDEAFGRSALVKDPQGRTLMLVQYETA